MVSVHLDIIKFLLIYRYLQNTYWFKRAVRGFLIRWKTVRFSIENRVIAHFVFYAESLRPRKVNKNFGSLKTALWIFCIFVSSIWIVM